MNARGTVYSHIYDSKGDQEKENNGAVTQLQCDMKELPNKSMYIRNK